jgi:hypothetical protein
MHCMHSQDVPDFGGALKPTHLRWFSDLPGLGNNNEKLGLPERLSTGIKFRFRNLFHGKKSGNRNFMNTTNIYCLFYFILCRSICLSLSINNSFPVYVHAVFSFCPSIGNTQFVFW